MIIKVKASNRARAYTRRADSTRARKLKLLKKKLKAVSSGRAHHSLVKGAVSQMSAKVTLMGQIERYTRKKR